MRVARLRNLVTDIDPLPGNGQQSGLHWLVHRASRAQA